jgi:uncharacterized membrane protein YdjX (TVP38/TMEM64 family)
LKDQLIQLFHAHPQAAWLLSLVASIIVAVLGVIPSFFITAANIYFFGFWEGTLISFLGEALGAFIAFLLYRKGFKKGTAGQLQKFPRLARLVETKDKEAFTLILALRLIPFVPSGLITFAAAVGRVSAFTFFVSSSLGKFPALLLEAWSVYQVTKFNWQGKLVLAVTALAMIYFLLRRKNTGPAQ